MAARASGILVDTFHANIEEKSIGAALRHAGSHLKHLHVCENDRGIPGSGHVAWAEFFSTVADLGYDRWMTIESFGFSLGALSTAAAVWRDLAPTPEAIAFEGVSSSAPTLPARTAQRQALTAHAFKSLPQGSDYSDARGCETQHRARSQPEFCVSSAPTAELYPCARLPAFSAGHC